MFPFKFSSCIHVYSTFLSYQLLISAPVILECTYVYSLVVLLRPYLKLSVQAKHKKKRQ